VRYLLLLFIAMPIIEIGVLIRVGGWLGLWTTLLIVILTAILGTWMLRQQSAATMMQAQNRLSAGELPAQQIFEGLLLLVGGVLLLTPGFVTDAIGFACLLPWSRQWLASQIASRSKNGAIFMGGGIGPGAGSGFGAKFGAGVGSSAPRQTNAQTPPSGAAGGSPKHQSNDVIEGDFKEID